MGYFLNLAYLKESAYPRKADYCFHLQLEHATVPLHGSFILLKVEKYFRFSISMTLVSEFKHLL